MGPRTSVAAGLIAGAAVGLALLVAIVLLMPEPSGAGPSPGPSSVASSPPASAGASAASLVPTTAGPGATTFHVGEKAPPLALPQLGGGTVSLGALAGKPVWIVFVQTTCGPCREELAVLDGFAARLASSGLVVIAVDAREDEGTVASFAQELKIRLPVALDADGTAQDAWGAAPVPVHFWIDKDGVIRAAAPGGIGRDEMARQLAKILPGVTITP